ncbi:MAG: NAD(P)H-dependent oxidoreductase [Elusimicrobiota bacterium]
MPRLLHIIATPRGEESRTLRVSRAFLDRFKAENPEGVIDELDLFKEELPPVGAKQAHAKYVLMAGGRLNGGTKSPWEDVERHIKKFLDADVYLVSAPMWNFGIPYVLKHYIDVIVQPGYLFRYNAQGPEGLVKDKKMVVVTSRGGDYGEGTPAHAFDLQEPYLRAVFGFVGITDITFVHAQGMDSGSYENREERIQGAISRVKRAAAGEWAEETAGSGLR